MKSLLIVWMLASMLVSSRQMDGNLNTEKCENTEHSIVKATSENEKQDVKIPADIHFADISSIHSFQELVGLYPGKVILIDIWATWCRPCLESFEHVKALQNYQALHDDVVLLYISINTPEDEAAWKESILRYDLKGEHVCANGELERDLYRLFGDKRGNLAIPYGAIIDREGNIAVKKTAALENSYKLIKELDKVRKSTAE